PLLIGREAEWRALSDAWDAGAIVALRGPSGMGKTRLLTDFVRAMGADGRRLLIVSARPGDERMPRALLSRLLRGVLARRRAPIAPGLRQELAGLLPEIGEVRPPSLRDATRF